MSSLLGLSLKFVQLVIEMVEISCGCNTHTMFALPAVAPQMFRCRGGGLSRAHSVGRPPCTADISISCKDRPKYYEVYKDEEEL